MQTREKVVVCAAPYLVGGYLWFALASPAMVSNQEKEAELVEKRREQIEISSRLFDVKHQQEERARLDREIGDLRGSVPKSPDIDILLIDLEKMCLDSNMDIVAIEPPERDKAKQAEEQEMPSSVSAAALAPRSGIALGQQSLGQAAAGTGPGAPGAAGRQGPATPVETGLNKLIKQVTVTGDYPGLVELMKKLESYQRVISVNQVEADLPPEAAQKKLHDAHLIVTFFMTAYYLP